LNWPTPQGYLVDHHSWDRWLELTNAFGAMGEGTNQLVVS
jgi:hypothetical protein